MTLQDDANELKAKYRQVARLMRQAKDLGDSIENIRLGLGIGYGGGVAGILQDNEASNAAYALVEFLKDGGYYETHKTNWMKIEAIGGSVTLVPGPITNP